MDPFLPDPLPDWAVAQIIGEGPNRFPRQTFGHEYFHWLRNRFDPNYVDLRIRAQLIYNLCDPVRRRRIDSLIEDYLWF